jgi:hypothetical protein
MMMPMEKPESAVSATGMRKGSRAAEAMPDLFGNGCAEDAS